MTHFLVAVDAYPGMHELFLNWLRHGGREKYPGNKTNWGIKVREVKLYDVVMPREWREPFLRDMRYFEGGGNMWQGRRLRDLLGVVIKAFKLPFKEVEMPKEGSARAEIESRGSLAGFWAEALTLVEMPDEFNHNENLEML